MTYTDPEGPGVCLPPGVHAFSVWFPWRSEMKSKSHHTLSFSGWQILLGSRGNLCVLNSQLSFTCYKNRCKGTERFLGDGTHMSMRNPLWFLCLLLTAGKELSVLCFEWMDLSCELPHQITHVHSTAVKKEFPYRVSLLGMCTLQSLRTEVLQETWTSPTSRTQGMSQQLRS